MFVSHSFKLPVQPKFGALKVNPANNEVTVDTGGRKHPVPHGVDGQTHFRPPQSTPDVLEKALGGDLGAQKTIRSLVQESARRGGTSRDDYGNT